MIDLYRQWKEGYFISNEFDKITSFKGSLGAHLDSKDAKKMYKNHKIYKTRYKNYQKIIVIISGLSMIKDTELGLLLLVVNLIAVSSIEVADLKEEWECNEVDLELSLKKDGHLNE